MFCFRYKTCTLFSFKSFFLIIKQQTISLETNVTKFYDVYEIKTNTGAPNYTLR